MKEHDEISRVQNIFIAKLRLSGRNEPWISPSKHYERIQETYPALRPRLGAMMSAALTEPVTTPPPLRPLFSASSVWMMQ